MAYVYRHIRKDTGQPFYIGIGLREKSENFFHSIGEDFDKLFRRANQGNRLKEWNEIVKKTNFSVEILESNLTIEDAIKKEREFIKLYGRVNIDEGGILCNKNAGLESFYLNENLNRDGKKISENLKKAHKNGLYKNAAEKRVKRIGKKIIQKTKEGKILKIWDCISRIAPELNKQGIKIKRPNIHKCVKGEREFAGGFKWEYEKNPILFKKSPRKVILFKGPISTSRKIVQKTLSGEFIQIWDYMQQIKNHTGIQISNINKCLNNERSQAGGFKWELYEKD